MASSLGRTEDGMSFPATKRGSDEKERAPQIARRAEGLAALTPSDLAYTVAATTGGTGTPVASGSCPGPSQSHGTGTVAENKLYEGSGMEGTNLL